MIEYREGELYCEGVRLADVVAQVSTPVYVYSRERIEANYHRVAQAFAELNPASASDLIYYAVKANSNLAVLGLLRDLGSGFDVVSGGELYRVMRVGADPARVAFAGAGKTERELTYALECQVGQVNVESAQELELLEHLAGQRNQTARVALRVNPGVDPHTHHHISTGHAGSKFGIDLHQVPALLERARHYPHLRLEGLHIHIGSQLPDPGPLVEAVRKTLRLVEDARRLGLALNTLDIGGGFPVTYRQAETVASIEEFARAVAPLLKPVLQAGASAEHSLAPHIEPGRCIVADAGVLLTQVQFVKHSAGRRIAVTDAGMTHLLRPALYDAYHPIIPLRNDQPATSNEQSFDYASTSTGRLWRERQEPQDRPATSNELTDIAGPICESSDYLGRDRHLPCLQRGDVLAVLQAGAYGATMASNYNSHPRAPEVLVEGETLRLIRRRETWEDLLSPEVMA